MLRLTRASGYSLVDIGCRIGSFYKTNTDAVLDPSILVLSTQDHISHFLKL